MKVRSRSLFIASVLSVFVLTFAAAFLFHFDSGPQLWTYSLAALSFAGAAVTITYEYPVATAGTVPPTVVQSLNANMVNAIVNWADADTTTLITHNFGSSTADLTSLFPVVIVRNRSDTTTTVAPVVTVALTNSNAITLGKGTIVGTQGTLTVNILRPHSIIR